MYTARLPQGVSAVQKVFKVDGIFAQGGAKKSPTNWPLLAKQAPHIFHTHCGDMFKVWLEIY